MLDTLLEAEVNGGQIDERGIQEEVDTFMFEGYDTTSAGLLFSIFMIATHQREQQGIYEEINAIVGKNAIFLLLVNLYLQLPTNNIAERGSDLGIHDYSEMKLLDRVIKETMRLYPPVPYISRQLMESVDIGNGVVLPRGTQVHVAIMNVHRDPEQFPDPNTFDSDRFLPVNSEHRHPFSYIPFSAGPRNCIGIFENATNRFEQFFNSNIYIFTGQKFALLEMKTLIVSILRKFQLIAVTKLEDVVLVSELVLRTKDPIRIRFVKRTEK